MSREMEMMIEGLTADVVSIIMEEEDLDYIQALDKFYVSDVFRKLERPETGLYYQSAVYLYDCLTEECNKTTATNIQ